MGKWFRAKPGKAAVYSSYEDSWDPLDNPLNHLPDINWHSDLDYLELAFRGTQSISHTLVDSDASQPPSGGISIRPTAWANAPRVRNFTLYTHNLGFRPYVLVQIGNQIITPGFAVQSNAHGIRILTVIVTNSIVQLREQAWTWTFGVDLPAINREYEIYGLAQPETTPALSDLRIDPGVFTTGRGKIDSTRRYLRATTPGETGIIVTNGKTADAANGVVRVVNPDGSTQDDAVFSNSSYRYDGNFSASDLNARSLSLADNQDLIGTYTAIGPGEKMMVVDDGHIVIDSDVSLAKFVQSISLSGVQINFPEMPQDLNVRYNASFLGGVTWGTGFTVHGTWRPQEYSATIDLGPVNPDANFIIGMAKGEQTHSPSNLGGNASASSGGGWEIVGPSGPFYNIANIIPEGSWVLANGTILLESTYMMRRTVSFSIEDGRFVALLQQSVGGFNTNNSTYRGNRDEDFGNANREVLTRLHRLGANVTSGGSSSPPPGWGGGGTYDPRGNRSYDSRWSFDLEFLIGHVG